MANSPGTVLRKYYESDPVLQGFEDGTLTWGDYALQEEEREQKARHARGEYTPRATPPGSPPRQTVPAYLPQRRAPSPQRRGPYKFGFQPRGYRQGADSVQQWLRSPPGYSRRSPSRSPPRHYSRRRSPSRGRNNRYSRRRSPSRSPSRGRYSRRRSHSRARSVNSFGRRLSYSPPRRTNTRRRGRGPRFFDEITRTYKTPPPSPGRK